MKGASTTVAALALSSGFAMLKTFAGEGTISDREINLGAQLRSVLDHLRPELESLTQQVFQDTGSSRTVGV